MGTIKMFFKEWHSVIWRSLFLAVFIGASLGVTSSIVIETCKSLDVWQFLLMIMGLLWIGSLLVAIYLTELVIKHKLRKKACVAVYQDHSLTRVPANHNERYIYHRL